MHRLTNGLGPERAPLTFRVVPHVVRARPATVGNHVFWGSPQKRNGLVPAGTKPGSGQKQNRLMYRRNRSGGTRGKAKHSNESGVTTFVMFRFRVGGVPPLLSHPVGVVRDIQLVDSDYRRRSFRHEVAICNRSAETGQCTDGVRPSMEKVLIKLRTASGRPWRRR
jgi:hypothetical protein